MGKFEVGQEVRIIEGALAGSVGTITQLTASGASLRVGDEYPDMVYLWTELAPVASADAPNGMTAHELYTQADARAAALEAENARLRAALEYVRGSLGAIKDYYFAPDAPSVNAENMTAFERTSGMASQALNAIDVIDEALVPDLSEPLDDEQQADRKGGA